MDKIETLENNNYYIVSLDNGIREEEPVEITYTNGDTVTKRIIFLPDE